MNIKLQEKAWWEYLEFDLQELVNESLILLERSHEWDRKFHDYSYVVFSAAKAYEGFLKKLFLDMGFITEREYFGKRFRIGKALNPALSDRYKGKSWVYGKLLSYCGGKEVPENLWKTWKRCRNRLFHWFPEEVNVVSLPEAKECLFQIFDAFDSVFKACRIKLEGENEAK